MRINDAIKELSQDISDTGEYKTPVLRAAQRLGIEALKREKDRRHSIYWSGAALLPGETEEEPSSEE